MVKYFKLYIKFLTQHLKSLMEYRIDFFVGLLSFLVMQVIGVATIFILFEQIPNLHGWQFEEVIFIYGFFQLPRGIDHLFTDNLWALSGDIIVNGKFDRYLLRPINPLFHLIAEVFQPDGFGELLVGIILVVYSASQLSLQFTIVELLLFILVIIFSTVIYTSIKLFFASFAFWIKFSQAVLYMFYSLSDFAKYPITIYSKWIQKIVMFIVPFAFTAYFPGGYFVGKVSLEWAVLGTGLAAVIWAVIGYTTWLQGINAYESVGH